MRKIPKQTRPRPGIERNIAERATKSIAPAVAVWLKLKSEIMAGISEGATYAENRKANIVRKTMVNVSYLGLETIYTFPVNFDLKVVIYREN